MATTIRSIQLPPAFYINGRPSLDPTGDAVAYVTDGERYGVQYEDESVDWLGRDPVSAYGDGAEVEGAGLIIEQETREGQYGMGHTAMIVDHPEHGRLLVVDGFGGVGTPKGGAYRWEHGAVYRLQPGDTLESLRATPWSDLATLYEAVIRGHDESRPALEWPGAAVRALAVGAA